MWLGPSSVPPRRCVAVLLSSVARARRWAELSSARRRDGGRDADRGGVRGCRRRSSAWRSCWWSVWRWAVWRWSGVTPGGRGRRGRLHPGWPERRRGPRGRRRRRWRGGSWRGGCSWWLPVGRGAGVGTRCASGGPGHKTTMVRRGVAPCGGGRGRPSRRARHLSPAPRLRVGASVAAPHAQTPCGRTDGPGPAESSTSLGVHAVPPAQTAGQILMALPGVAVVRAAAFSAYTLPIERGPTPEHL